MLTGAEVGVKAIHQTQIWHVWTLYCTDGKTDSKEVNKRQQANFQKIASVAQKTKTETLQLERNAWGWVEWLRAE